MDISTLATQYRESADLLETRIITLKIQLKTARGDTAFLLQRRIDVLYLELLDTRRTMGYLRNYYS